MALFGVNHKMVKYLAICKKIALYAVNHKILISYIKFELIPKN